MSTTLTRETFNAWSIALEDQAEKDYESKTVVFPDGIRTMTAKPTLAHLQRFAGDQVHVIQVGETRNLWPKYAFVARSETVELNDPSEDATPRQREQSLRNLICNAERLTGITAKFVSTAKCLETMDTTPSREGSRR